MTKPEARAALAAFDDVIGDVESWIAGQPWKAEAGGWSVLGELHGLHFHLEVMAGGVRVVASAAGGIRRCGSCRRELGATYLAR